MIQPYEKQISFNPEMAQAILAGRKTQTRRLMKPQPEHVDGGYFWPRRFDYQIAWAAEDSTLGQKVGEYKPGFEFDHEVPESMCPYGGIGRWFLVGSTSQQITGIRAERIHQINEEAALAEGIDLLLCPQCGCSGSLGDTINTRCRSQACGLDNFSAIERFREVWEGIYPGSWERNDWVWVIIFKAAS